MDQDSDTANAYRTLKATFDHARRMFSETSSILIPEELDIKELGDQETIQMANMATICASLFEASDVPLAEVHEYFLMTFLPETGSLPDDLAQLFLSLKTQLCVAMLTREPNEAARLDVLDRVFPVDLTEQLQQLHPDMPLLPSEQSFLADAKSRRESLLEDLATDEARSTVSPLRI